MDILAMRELARTRLLAPVERTALALAGIQLALHVTFALASKDPRILVPHLVAWTQDACLLSLMALLANIPARLGARLTTAILRGALLALGATLAIYPRMLQSYLAFPVSVFSADIGIARLFLLDYLGWRGLWPSAIALVAGVIAPRLEILRLPCKRAFLGVALSVLFVTCWRPAPNPLVFSLQDRLSLLTHGRSRAVPRLVPGRSGAAHGFDEAPSPLEVDRPMRYDRVLLVVLESVTASAFERELLHRDGGFAERNAAHCRYFRRYYSLNQDSYTSLIAMTTSVEVPFRSYADPARYDAVNRLPNAPRALKKKGYRALFVSTYEHQPFVPNRADWGRIADRRDLPTLHGFVSLGTSRMEAATEDRAAIPLILSELRAAPRALVLAELVYGHAPEWRAVTGIAQLDYYDAYLTELIEGVAQAGLAPKTLVLVVSDHGERSKVSDPDNYRVPLLVVGETVAPGEDDELRSHLDLQDILAHSLMGTSLPPPRSRLMVVGSTERWVYGEIAGPSEHLFIDDQSGTVLSRGGSLEPVEVHRRFQGLVDEVDATRVRP